jgi:hypothetical protein
MIRRPAASSASIHGAARVGSPIASSMSSTGPGAPPWSGPLSAPIAATIADTRSEPVEVTTRAAKVEAFIPWSATVTR